ncbi:MAG TPA: GAF domain-containing protein, partial [Rhodanobacteraceae bacterium]
MTDVLSSPAFGQADLTNCERELIHLAGSIQPHGLLLVVREPSLEIAKASVNAGTLLRLPSNDLIGRRLDSFGGDLAAEVRRFIEADGLDETQPMRCTVAGVAGPIDFEGSVHRCGEGLLVVELEPLSDADSGREVRGRALRARLASAIEDCSGATSIVGLADTVVRALREIVGYDRVMVYKFDPDGHGEIIAEARDEALDSLLGHHYPATDIPQRARALYLRNRVRLLVDVHYDAVPIEPAGRELDMSLCQLRSMSPLHLQYLKNMGVTATLVVSLVREGRLWGLIACHHYRPRRVGYSVRAACALLAEVISTRITAIENYSHAQGVILLRSLEQRLIDATSTDGDWRRALFQHPHALLQPMNATGAALFFEGEIMTSGEVPSTPELRKLLLAVASRAFGGTFSTASISREHPDLASINATASGVVAVALSTSRPDYLMWFRGEQVSEVTWAGDPAKAVIDNDPLNLSPRRSFAAWSQIVRGSASPWSSAELSLAQAIGATLIDIILQIQAVRLLIAQHQFALVEVTVQNSKEPVV